MKIGVDLYWIPVDLSKHVKCLSCIYLRNLLMHTVNNLLQTLNNVKSIQFFVVKQKFDIIHIMCGNFKTIPWVLCKKTAYLI